MSRIGIIMGSDSDIPKMKGAAEILDALELSYESTICSAHRTPDRTVAEFSREQPDLVDKKDQDFQKKGFGG